ncbi:MAG: flagellar basal body P-ring formation protein FlgA [Desulfatibacillum sp.]|nr:flagellar basal body P-ring formation protein FlgA [Desulfatibacillum sp.]
MKHLFAHKSIVLILRMVLFLSLVLAVSSALAGEPGIRVPSEAWVRGDEVYLGDIAVISGLEELSEQIKSIHVGSAPAPGKRRAVRGAMIQAKLDRLDLPAGANVEVPPRILVHRLSQEVEDREFETMLADYLNGKLFMGNIEITRFQVNGNGPVSEGILDVTMEELRSDKYYGQVSIRGIISVDGMIERRVSIAAWVDYEAPVVVAKHNLDRMDILSAQDVTTEMQNLARLPDSVLTDPREVKGMRIRQGLEAGKILQARMLEKPPLVEKGDDVTIMASSGSMSISTLGTAQEAGGLGDSIEVENVMSEKIITCRVTGPAKVEVRF